MNQEFIIRSEKGDEYRLRIATESTGLLSDEVLQKLSAAGVEVIDIELERTQGLNFTNLLVLGKIVDCIADVFLAREDFMICFFCDFISLVPSMKKEMSVQEYRSRLFSNMFERYVRSRHINGIRNQVVVVKGIAEDYFVHVIAREKHAGLTTIIGEGIQRDFGK